MEEQSESIVGQLMRVAEQAAKEGYVMGERYDMNYVYYIDDKDWHGAAHYYEYPCVYSWVLIHEYLSIRQTFEADLQISPRVMNYGSVVLEQSGYQLSYRYEEQAFQLTNLGSETRSFEVDLTAIYPACKKWKFSCEGVEGVVEPGSIVTIDGGLTGTWGADIVNLETSALFAACESCNIASTWIGFISDCLVDEVWDDWHIDSLELSNIASKICLEVIRTIFERNNKDQVTYSS
ncbi:hypothetical protein [Paenibacillus rhizovicinus]|uniref:hypothetical protein n=1 Tax=Paenibacillus rhizovicinus TaxID=2704463 RepID=UPI0017818667|nr:hypothetical protein [Paenibacillus rhizovicinus]